MTEGAGADSSPPDTVVWDLGNVLIRWDPRLLYRKLLPDEAAVEQFLATVCTADWNLEQDRGRDLAEATAELQARFPQHAELIAAYYGRWPEMLGGPIDGSVAVLRELHEGGVRLLALTNWQQALFPIALERYDFFGLFEGIVVSGQERLVKPDPRIYRLLIDRFGVDPARAVFVDDSGPNVEAASALGFRAVRFTDPVSLRAELGRLGVPRGSAG